MAKTLEGSTALVTGATSGIGHAVALQLARLGAEVVVHGRSAERGAKVVQEIKNDGGKAQFVAADLADPDDVRRLAAEAGPVDILINNAGIYKFGATADTDDAIFDEHVNINVRAPFILVQQLVPGMAERGKGAVVNLSTVAATIPARTGGIYGATKAGLELLTRVWADEFGPSGVRVNAVEAGPTENPWDRGHPRPHRWSGRSHRARAGRGRRRNRQRGNVFGFPRRQLRERRDSAGHWRTNRDGAVARWRPTGTPDPPTNRPRRARCRHPPDNRNRWALTATSCLFVSVRCGWAYCGHRRDCTLAPHRTDTAAVAARPKHPDRRAGPARSCGHGITGCSGTPSTGPTPAPQQTELPFTGLSLPAGLAVDAGGNVYVSDQDNKRVLELSAG